MTSKSIKKIWLFCLCVAGLSLAGCFHIPDEDWLLSDNEVETENAEKGDEVEQAINSFMQWINVVSSQRNDMKDEESNEIMAEEINIEVDTWNIQQNEEITNNEVKNDGVKDV